MARRKRPVAPWVYVYYNEAAETYWVLEQQGEYRRHDPDGFRQAPEERTEAFALALAAAWLGCDRDDLDVERLANDPDREEMDAYGAPIPQENFRCTVDAAGVEWRRYLAELQARRADPGA